MTILTMKKEKKQKRTNSIKGKKELKRNNFNFHKDFIALILTIKTTRKKLKAHRLK